MLLAVGSWLAMALVAGEAPASQYNVSEVPKLVLVRDAKKLHKAGVHSTEDVLRAGATSQGRAALARRAGLTPATVAVLARRADLLRLDDIGPEQVLLLEAAGVRSVADLAGRDPTALIGAAAAVNKAKKIASPFPPDARFRAWVTQAKKLPVVLAD